MAICGKVNHGRARYSGAQSSKARYRQVQCWKDPSCATFFTSRHFEDIKHQVWYWEVCLGHQWQQAAVLHASVMPFYCIEFDSIASYFIFMYRIVLYSIGTNWAPHCGPQGSQMKICGGKNGALGGPCPALPQPLWPDTCIGIQEITTLIPLNTLY